MAPLFDWSAHRNEDGSSGLRWRRWLDALQRQDQGVPVLRTLGTLTAAGAHAEGNTNNVGTVDIHGLTASQTILKGQMGAAWSGALIVAVAHAPHRITEAGAMAPDRSCNR